MVGAGNGAGGAGAAMPAATGTGGDVGATWETREAARAASTAARAVPVDGSARRASVNPVHVAATARATTAAIAGSLARGARTDAVVAVADRAALVSWSSLASRCSLVCARPGPTHLESISTNGPSAAASDAASAKRFSASFSRHRAMTRTSSAGRSWRSSSMGRGGSRATFTHRSGSDSASNGQRRVRNS